MPAVAVLRSTTSFRRGLQPAFEAAGFTVDPDVTDASVAVLVVVPIGEVAEAMPQLLDHPAHVVVALLEVMSPPMVAEAFRHGAAAVADWDAPPEEILSVLEHALSGRAIVPSMVARWMATEMTVRGGAPAITEEELTWVRLLSKGRSVISLSGDYGYSERVMFRRLADLYDRMGASNRDEAMVAAERFGFLD